MIINAFWQHKIDILRVKMSQIGGKMSKFYGETDIVSTDLHIILSNFVATDVYALFRKSIKKIIANFVKFLRRFGNINSTTYFSVETS